jgi:hypothetical protein
MAKCNMEEYLIGKGLVVCDEFAEWKHPRWPTGMYCTKHKEDLEFFWPNNWKRIKEDGDGK